MEKKQKVFIKSVPGRCEEIIKALEDCGGYCSHHIDDKIKIT